MKIGDITSFLEAYAPLEFQESYDNSGLIIGSESAIFSKALIALDATEEVLDEAISGAYDLLLTHHPIVFSGLKKLNGNNYIERVVLKAVKNDIAIYASHTNLDNVKQGVNARIADKLNLIDQKILSPKAGLTYKNESVGSGMIGMLPTEMSEAEVMNMIKEKMNTDCIRATAFLNKPVRTIALCGGSGSFLLEAAINANADLFLSGDFKYHQFFDADGKIIIADIGHYESEQFTTELLKDILTEKFPNFAFHISSSNTNPIKYI